MIKTFLLDDDAPVDLLATELRSHRQSFASLKRSLREANCEILDPKWPRLPEYSALINELNGLTQHIGGLNSCIGVQRDYISQQRMQTVMAALQGSDQSRLNNGETLRRFLSGIGPVVRALGYTCRRTLSRLEHAIETGARLDTARLHGNLELALMNFDRERSIALRRLYNAFGKQRQWDLIRSAVKTQAAAAKAVENGGTVSSNEPEISEDLFPVYFFLFSFKRFARQLEKVIDAVDRLQQAEQRGFWAGVKQRILAWRASKLVK
jgi:hypothetical protein